MGVLSAALWALLSFAPPLRVTAPVRRGVLEPWSFLRGNGRKAGPVSKDHGGQWA